MYDEIENVALQYKVLDAIAIGLCILRSDWIVLFWNRYLEQYTKIAQSEIVGTSLLVHFNQLNPTQFASYGDQIFQNQEEVHFSVSLNIGENSPTHSQKESSLEQVTLTPLSTITGEGNYALLTLHNPLTESNYCQPSTSLVKKQSELEQFIDRISHDLREPLRMVVNFNELIAQRYSGQLDSTGNQMIHFAVDGARRMQQMIDGLLVYSRLKTRYQLPQPIDAQISLKQAIMELQSLIVKTEAQISTTPLPIVMANHSQLTQLFSILIENAIQYCRNHPPKIEIAVQSQADFWLFSVRDNGIGIDQKYHQAIFEIFRRLHSRQDYPGIGMGLAIAKKIVELHQGCIWINSQTQQGSTFYFTLPNLPKINSVLTSSENFDVSGID